MMGAYHYGYNYAVWVIGSTRKALSSQTFMGNKIDCLVLIAKVHCNSVMELLSISKFHCI
jgi:hypothetical protein